MGSLNLEAVDSDDVIHDITGDVKLRTVKIGPAWFDIYVSDKIQAKDGLEMLGFVDVGNCRIVISDNQTPDMKRVSIIHEILHAIFSQGAAEQDEDTVAVAAYGLALLIDQNGRFFEWLEMGVDL